LNCQTEEDGTNPEQASSDCPHHSDKWVAHRLREWRRWFWKVLLDWDWHRK